ncbi:hypothetical protein CVA01_01520 [Corynebacterium variabile]|uniref:Uncharacterized protein n=1 Tax=Corynebacterium variabile TaxID=1727 RepID=A0A4Y4BWK5_9CORY|nr:hypothetical protein CVA01_01520 [Corynebacterium variabile]
MAPATTICTTRRSCPGEKTGRGSVTQMSVPPPAEVRGREARTAGLIGRVMGCTLVPVHDRPVLFSNRRIEQVLLADEVRGPLLQERRQGLDVVGGGEQP